MKWLLPVVIFTGSLTIGVYPIKRVAAPSVSRVWLIHSNLTTMLKKWNRPWSYHFREKIVRVLVVGEKMGVFHQDILAIISIESWYKIRRPNCKNRNGTCDYGLTQQNSRSVWRRYRRAAPILRRNMISYNPKDIYDPALNVMSAVLYLRDIQRATGRKRGRRYIASYNTGMRGYFLYPKKAARYYRKWLKERKKLL